MLAVKKLWGIASVALSLALIVGCSSGSNGNSGSTSGNIPSGNTQSGNASGSKTQINFYILSGWETPMNKAADEFMKENPDITIRLQSYPFRQLFETMEVMMGSKSTDLDVVLTDGPLVSNYVVKGYLEPLDDLLGQEAIDSFIPSSLDAGTVNNQFYAAPLNTSSQVLYYNKGIFEEKGVEVPEFDIEKRWTWEQVVEAGQKLTYDTNGDGQSDIFGFSFEQLNRPYQLLSLANGLGGKPISEDGLKSDGYTNSPEMVQAGQFYSDLFNTYSISPKITADETVEYFATGKLAMFVGGPWNVGRFTEAGLNFGFAPHPYFEGHTAATPTGSWHIGISKFSEKKEATAKFIEFMTAGEGAEIWVTAHNDVPARTDLLAQIDEDPKYDSFPDNIMRLAAYEANNTAVSRPKSPGYLEWETLMDKAFDDMRNGSDPKQALDSAVSQIDRQLEKYAAQ